MCLGYTAAAASVVINAVHEGCQQLVFPSCRVLMCCVFVLQASKGSAFLWYQTKEQADGAIAYFESNPCRLTDPSGQQDRPLVVRRATKSVHNASNRAMPNIQSFWPSMLSYAPPSSMPLSPSFHAPYGVLAAAGSASSGSVLDICDAMISDRGVAVDTSLHTQPLVSD